MHNGVMARKGIHGRNEAEKDVTGSKVCLVVFRNQVVRVTAGAASP